MHAGRHALLEQALELTRQMGAHAQNGAWDAVIELERQRRTALEQAFAVEAPVDDTTAARIRTILDLDRQLIELGSQARDAVAGELSSAQRGRKVARAYGAVSN
jgi:hypothetical protein